MATAKELNDLSVEDLGRRATELRGTIVQDNLKLRTGSLDNPSERTGHKRDLARVLTVLTAKNKKSQKAK
jgi:large subunit ribosomal protein L29